MKSLIYILLFIVSLIPVYAQNAYLKTTVHDLRVCGEEETFQIEVRNVNGQSNAIFYNVVVKSELPPGIQYTGNLLGANGLHSTHKINHPAFEVGTIYPGETKIISFNVKANCEIISYINDRDDYNIVNNNTTMSYNFNGYYQEPFGSESYNIYYPYLLLQVDEPDKTLTAVSGTFIERNFTVTNNGNGYIGLEGIVIEISNNNSGLEIEEILGIGNTIYKEGGKTYIKITDFTEIGNGDAFFQPQEKIYLTERAKITSCSNRNVSTNYAVLIHCQNNCPINNNSQDGASVNIILGYANVSASLNYPSSFNFCSSEVVGLTISNYSATTIYNERTATNLEIVIAIHDLNSISDFMIRNANGVMVAISPSSIQNKVYRFNYNSFKNVSGGVDGLADYNNDERFDDLLPTSSCYMEFTKHNSCPTIEVNQRLTYNSFTCTAQYKDVCGTANSRSTNGPSSYSNFNSATIDGPLDLLSNESGQYKFTLSRTTPSGLTCPSQAGSSSFSSEIKFPSAYKVEAVRWNNQLLAADQFVQDTDGTLHIYQGNWSGTYLVDVVLDCGLSENLDVMSDIIWNMYVECTPTCCRLNIGQAFYEVFNHCQGGDGMCITTQSFNVERTTFDYPEPATGFYLVLPSQRVDGSQQRKDAGIPSDIIQSIVKGKVLGGPFNETHVELQYISPVDNDNILEFTDGYFLVNGNQYLINTPPQIRKEISSKGSSYFFDFVLEGYGVMEGGEQVDLYANFKIKDAAYLGYGEFLLKRFRAFHYGINDGDRYGCESLGAKFTVVINRFIKNPVFQSPSFPCSAAERIIGINFKTEGSSNGDPFPNEFRPQLSIDKIEITIPSDVDNNTPYFVHETHIGLFQQPEVRTLEDGSKIKLWDKQVKPDVWPIFDPGNNHWLSVDYFINTNCLRNITNKYTSVDITYTFFPDKPELTHTSKKVSSFQIRKNFPNIEFSNFSSLVEGYNNSVTWQVNMRNMSSNISPRNWLLFEPPSNIVLESASIGNTSLEIVSFDSEHPERKLIKLNSFGAYSYPTIKLTASASDCFENSIDNIDIKVNFDCSVYPDDPYDLGCGSGNYVNSTLKIRYKNAELQSTVIKDNEVSTLCDAVPYEVELRSTGMGDIHDAKLKIDPLPEGFKYVSGSSQYQFIDLNNDQTWYDLADPGIMTDESLVWDVSDEILNQNPFVASSSIKVKFNLEIGCEASGAVDEWGDDAIDIGKPVRITSLGTTNCNDTRILPYQSKIFIQDFDTRGIELIPNIITNRICFNDVASHRINLSITNSGSISATEQYLTVLLPSEVEYAGFPDEGYEPDKTFNTQFGTIIRWRIPETIDINQTLEGFSVFVNVLTQEEQEILVKVRTSMQGSAICSTTGESCSLVSTTGTNSATIELTQDGCDCPVPNISFTAGCAGKPVDFCLNLGNGRDFDPLVEITWSFGDGSSSSATYPNHIFEAPGVYPVTINIKGPSNCKFQETFQVVIDDCPSIPSCEGDCIPSFSPVPGERYVVSGWVKEDYPNAVNYQNAGIIIRFDVNCAPSTQELFRGKGLIIDGWQRIEEEFVVPLSAFFDDIRIHPFNATMKSFVYDPISMRLMAELDENNYATFYEYDEEGNLIRVKKETERGIKTIQESRNNIIKNNP